MTSVSISAIRRSTTSSLNTKIVGCLPGEPCPSDCLNRLDISHVEAIAAFAGHRVPEATEIESLTVLREFDRCRNWQA
jgi:hypothetical protein